MNKRILFSILLGILLVLLSGIWWFSQTQRSPSRRNTTDTISATSQKTEDSPLQTVDYEVVYQGYQYNKNAVVYVPEAYQDGQAMNIFYLMHGSGMNHVAFAEVMQPLFEQWIAAGEMEPMLVVFPTYYPDSSFVVSNYTEDYPLNHFFATEEIDLVMKTVESQFTTYAENPTEQGFEESRSHRAFGGYSMGGITTWDVLVDKSQYFHDYMPMAGDSWIGQVTGQASDEAVAETLVSGLRKNQYSSEDFTIIAMVGENDGTKYSIQPQLDALRQYHGDLVTTDNLIYWENANGGHNQESLELEVQHGVTYLFRENKLK